MKRNLNRQLKTKLKFLKKKQKFLFLRTVFLNIPVSSSSILPELRLSVLFQSDLSNRLKKNNSSFSCITSQCLLTWRTRSVYSFFNMSRISLREFASFGLIKGLKKSSW